MENVYKIEWGDESCKAGHNNVVSCAWSSTNLFAFTTEKEINGHQKLYLNILNPNQPWDIFNSQYAGGEIKCLEWDRTGTRLLSCDSHGNCCVWTLDNNMSNRWVKKSSWSVELPGEDILAVKWLHHGVKVLFHIDKMDFSNLNEKFQRLVFKPSAVQCGGKHVDGYIFVSSSGLVHVQCINSDKDPTYGQFYLNLPGRQQIADIRFTSQGKILILTSNGDIYHFVQFHEVQLNYDSIKRNISIEVNTYPSFSVQCIEDQHNEFTRISHIKFVSLDNQEVHVLVCLASPGGSRLEAWILKKDNVTVHKIFQQTSSLSHATPEITKSWQFVKSSELLPKVLDFSIPSNVVGNVLTTLSKTANEIKFFCGFTISVTLANNTIQLLHRLSLQTMYSYPIERRTEDAIKLSIRSSVFSTLSCAVMVVDEKGSLLLYKLSPGLNFSKAPTEARKQIIQLLLYCLVTGSEWWEIMLHLVPSSAASVVDLLAAEVAQQSKPLQQSLKSRLLSMKISLYQLSNTATATDCHLKLLFEAVTLVFRALFRPPQQVTSEESDPSLRLQIVCRTSTETDISHYLQSVDGVPQCLLSMQQLIQWIADVTLYLLASVPYHQMNKAFIRPCSALIRDKEWLSLLRELLVIIRVWMLLKNACSPVFHVLDSNIEILPHAFRLITMLWQTCSPDSIHKDLPSPLIDECCLLPSQVIIPPLEIVPAVNGVLSHLSISSHQLQLKFGESQLDVAMLNSRQRKSELVALPGSSGKIDSLRRVYLGTRPPHELKECTRCGIVTMYNSLGPSMLKMWDQRFIKSCLCGGMWRKMNDG